MRAPFIILNICGMPRFSTPPTSSPWQLPFSPKLSTHVDEPMMPILCSSAVTATSLLSPDEPSALMRSRGTMKSDSPLVPGGAPSMRASTRCTTFSVKSWSPDEM